MRRKMILALMLAIVNSVWTTNEASDKWCMPSVRTLTEPWIEVNGTFQAEGFPCEPDEECPPCLTIVLVTSDKTYYLVTDDGQLIEQLDTIKLGTTATVSGIPFTHGSYNYIEVHNIEIVHTPLRINSLCDEWNVLTTAIYEYSTQYFTFSQKLTTDTIIGDNMYVKSEVEHKYNGAYREGENRDIYFVPAAMNKEFLVYAWNAQVGDTLYNILVSSYPMYGLQYSNKAVVREIKETTPRTFIVDYEYIYNRKIDSADTIWWEYQWIEGIGMTCGASGDLCPFDKCQDSIKSDLLCAYKNGEQVYSSSKSERYGCEFNGIPSTKPYHLCDEWNILEVSNVTCGGCEEYRTYHSQLTKDTIISGKVYAQLIEDGAYRAALREGNKRDIYCIPAGSTHEYLLYDFDVQAGDQLENLWLGGMSEDYPNGWTMTVEEIQEGTPRKYVLSTGYTQPEEGLEVYPLYCTWIEGVGLSDGPVGVKRCVGCADSRGYGVLCAYKNGEHRFTSDLGEQYGCVYNYDPYSTPVDTIPLYAGDDPGSSTVDPVDPNQVVVTLKGDELSIHENMGVDITYTLQHNSPAQAPSQRRAPQSDTFRDEVTIQITASGEYLLQLTNPSWDYTIFGRFYYSPQGIWNIVLTEQAQKVMVDGVMYIVRDGKMFNVQGAQVR